MCGKVLAFLVCTVLVACGLQDESSNLIVTDKTSLNSVSASWPLLDGDKWYYIDSSGALAARNIKAHKTVVVCKLPVGATAFAAHSGHVFVHLSSTAIVSIDVNSARIEWQTSRFGSMTDVRDALVSDGSIYVSGFATLAKIREKTGKVEWSAPPDGIFSDVAVRDGAVITNVTYNGSVLSSTVRTYDAQTGKELAEFTQSHWVPAESATRVGFDRSDVVISDPSPTTIDADNVAARLVWMNMRTGAIERLFEFAPERKAGSGLRSASPVLFAYPIVSFTFDGYAYIYDINTLRSHTVLVSGQRGDVIAANAHTVGVLRDGTLLFVKVIDSRAKSRVAGRVERDSRLLWSNGPLLLFDREGVATAFSFARTTSVSFSLQCPSSFLVASDNRSIIMHCSNEFVGGNQIVALNIPALVQLLDLRRGGPG